MEIKALRKNKNLDFWFDATNNLTEVMQEQLYKYYVLIHEYNKNMNLTGIDDLHGVYLKHFYDSITIDNLITQKSNCSIADLGSGAGFPGIILAIIYPENNIYLIEPLTKRCKFLEIVVKELNLSNTTILNQRAEDIELRFDYVVSRAVARLNILLELAIPLVTVDGYFIALKGAIANEEIKEALNAIEKLYVNIEALEEVILPIENSRRANIKFIKFAKTKSIYPRNFGQIKKNPL
ncbi:MAG: 16S rRNA (guanine(527)-N(7))-methyltransferase RsmG [Mycoplasmatales bacterium]